MLFSQGVALGYIVSALRAVGALHQANVKVSINNGCVHELTNRICLVIMTAHFAFPYRRPQHGTSLGNHGANPSGRGGESRSGRRRQGKEKEKDLNVKATFSDTDPRDAQRGGPSQTRVVKLKAGQTYVIDMISNEVDSYLRLLDAKDNRLDEDDDSGGMLNSRIRFNCSKDGDYKIVCTTFAANMTGSYTLSMKIGPPQPKQLSAHALLLEKAAPEIKADFAAAGKLGKLGDFKGKVVLLYFWEVRSTPSLALLPVVNDWLKAHKDAGLVVIGVTYYPSDIGQKLGFDKDSGKS